jgi:hypothetical protein
MVSTFSAARSTQRGRDRRGGDLPPDQVALLGIGTDDADRMGMRARLLQPLDEAGMLGPSLEQAHNAVRLNRVA